MRPFIRSGALPVVAVVLVSGVLAVQAAAGGGQFAPLRPANPCAVRDVSSVSPGIDGLAERLVNLGLDRAACQLGSTREALLLHIAQSSQHSDTQINALRTGLLEAVDRMKADRSLPPAVGLVNQAVSESSLNGLVKAAIQALPDSVINASLKTDEVLRDTIKGLDLRALLANLNNSDALSKQIDTAVRKAVEQSLLDRVRGLLS